MNQISDILAWGTATAYCIGMVAYAIDLSRARTEADLERRSKAAGIATSVTFLGVLLHLAAVITRAVAAGRAPWGNMYEFALVGSAVAVLAFLILQWSRPARFLGVFVTGIATLLLVVALNAWHVKADGLQPALQSYWLILHVGVAVLATGIFAVAFVVACLQLLKDSRLAGSVALTAAQSDAGGTRPWWARDWRWLDALPSPARLEAMCFRLNAIGFVLWTFTLIGGSIWAEDAWGRYWGWDAKEVWTFIVWVVYAAYLHARSTRGWSGRKAAWFVVVGFACVIFNFTGVNLFFSTKHGYAGV